MGGWTSATSVTLSHNWTGRTDCGAGVDLGRLQQPDLVVVAQRRDRQTRSHGKGTDIEQLVCGHPYRMMSQVA